MEGRRLPLGADRARHGIRRAALGSRAAWLLATLACTPALHAAPPRGPVERFTAYLRIDTSNPPGNEKAGALFLKSILDEAGIPSELDEPAPGRANLYARLKGTGPAPGLLLHHHVDVVPADAAAWRGKPFGAEREGERITARGALDDKGLGIAELETFLALAKRKLTRDVVFLATADEEAGGALGVASVAARHPEWLSGIGFAVGEGGEVETVLDTARFFGLEVAQKSALWLRLSAKGAGGHAATPDPRNAPARLTRLLASLLSWKRPLAVSPTVEDALKVLAPLKPKDLGSLLISLGERARKDPEGVRAALTPRFLSLVSDTLAVTRLGPSTGAPNSVPETAFAELDCRLLPETDARAFLDEVRKRAAAEDVRVDVLLDAPGGPVSPKGELYEALSEALRAQHRSAVVAPVLCPGTSENRVLRARGIVTYGVTPFRVNVYDLSGIHGANERIRADWFLEGVHVLTDAAGAFAAGR